MELDVSRMDGTIPDYVDKRLTSANLPITVFRVCDSVSQLV